MFSVFNLTNVSLLQYFKVVLYLANVFNKVCNIIMNIIYNAQKDIECFILNHIYSK